MIKKIIAKEILNNNWYFNCLKNKMIYHVIIAMIILNRRKQALNNLNEMFEVNNSMIKQNWKLT